VLPEIITCKTVFFLLSSFTPNITNIIAKQLNHDMLLKRKQIFVLLKGDGRVIFGHFNKLLSLYIFPNFIIDHYGFCIIVNEKNYT